MPKKEAMQTQLINEDGYRVWMDYSGRHTYLEWNTRSSGSGVPRKYKKIWQGLKRLGEYLMDQRKSFGLAFHSRLSLPKVTLDFYESDPDRDWKIKVYNVSVLSDGEAYDMWRIQRELDRGWYGNTIKKWNAKNKKLVERKLGLTIKSFFYYKDDLSLDIRPPNITSRPQIEEVYVPSGTGNDREMVLSALEDRLGFYPTEFEILDITPFEDEEDIVRVQYRAASFKRIANRFLSSSVKGHFILRGNPSTIFISDGRNTIHLATEGKYKGKFIPFEGVLPAKGLMPLPTGKDYGGIHISGNIVSEISSVLRERNYEVVAPALSSVRSITYSKPFDPKKEYDQAIGIPLSYGEPTGFPEIDDKRGF